MTDAPAPVEPFVGHIAEIPWQEYPGHFGGALSKALVRPETCGSRRIDFRISSYQPMACVQEHVHQVQEQVYHVLEGEGLLTLDERRVLMRRHVMPHLGTEKRARAFGAQACGGVRRVAEVLGEYGDLHGAGAS